MELSQGQQGILLGSSVLLGGCLGFLFDLLRLFLAYSDRPHPKHPRAHVLGLRILQFFQDLLFVLVSCWSLVILLYYTNDGQIRLLAVCGMACGFLLYRRTVGRVASRVIPFAARTLRRAVQWTVTVLLLPLVAIGRLVSFLWRHTGGKYLQRMRRKQTERRMEDMVDSASHGFDLFPNDSEKR